MGPIKKPNRCRRRVAGFALPSGSEQPRNFRALRTIEIARFSTGTRIRKRLIFDFEFSCAHGDEVGDRTFFGQILFGEASASNERRQDTLIQSELRASPEKGSHFRDQTKGVFVHASAGMRCKRHCRKQQRRQYFSSHDRSPKAERTLPAPAMTGNTAERLIAAADASPKVFDWVALQLKAGRKPSEILADLERAPGGPG
ncbi:hypothetical protein [Mesorhizobium sp.]|uniref:hypothetical protein n=1 Tax=Mesorhizobium sp. TaxID=1871066 RepID=UPI0011FD33E9|nr:hypothetical protein [Mesorhizobium sp.]TIL29998.1 MAG: hypothetical protein E5Y85_25550 [Mesorhizobium sp.]